MTIPASELVRVIPNVLNAGGSALDLTGLILTQNTQVPVGEVLAFPNDGVSVAAYFGASAQEVEIADIYFDGFDNSTQKPEQIFFARYTGAAASAYVRGAPVNTLTIQQLKGLSGSLSVVVDGLVYAGAAIDLAAATSYSAAAAIIEAALNATPPAAAEVTGDIAAGTGSVTGGISGNVLTVTTVGSGMLVPGALITGTGVSAGTQITSQLSGDTGNVGTYAVNIAQAVDSGTAISASFGILTVSAVASGTLTPGQILSGDNATAGTQLTAYGTGEGLAGTYYVDLTQTAASATINADGPDLDVSYDSISGGFVIMSGWWGDGSTIAFPTGTLAAPVFMTEDTGAILSQGSDATTPGAFMTSIVAITQNWATFMLATDPDAGNGCEQKILFAEWTNAADDRYAYVAVDTDVTPRGSADATTSFGNRVAAAGLSGSAPISVSNGQRIDAFVCGTAASIDFDATNGRITFAYKGQSGLIPDVTDATAANNLIANGYNFYGAYATANDQFRLFQKGAVSGNFQWLDSYINQIWLNNALQLALMNLLSNINSVPYNQPGYDLLKEACADPIAAALNCGVIRSGVALSSQQAAQINTAAGVKVSDVIFEQGWYLQVKDAAPIVRQARESPPMSFWYTDGQSIQKIELASILIQ